MENLLTCPGATQATADCYVGAMRYPEEEPPPPQPENTTEVVVVLTEEKEEEDKAAAVEQQPPPLSSSLWDETVGITIVYGRIVPGNYRGAPEMNDFVVHNARAAAASSSQTILYYSVRRDYRKCIFPLSVVAIWLKALATTKRHFVRMEPWPMNALRGSSPSCCRRSNNNHGHQTK
jgi:hypothetical protein